MYVVCIYVQGLTTHHDSAHDVTGGIEKKVCMYVVCMDRHNHSDPLEITPITCLFMHIYTTDMTMRVD